ncbi:hypothetical protein K1719_025471 [Acacia pycnantha]|nr:hypothetical protein K1719_025471 [Acacia pycnantha]
MVCQAASQTRFRALKHENGTAGCSTIIVRVIACFQPLRECQAEYFRQLLKPLLPGVLFPQVIVLVEWEKIVEPGSHRGVWIGDHPT